MELSGAVLDAFPDLPGRRRGALGTHEVVHPRLELAKRVLDVDALGEAGAQEDCVKDDKDPRSALEQEGGDEEAEPKEDLECRDDRHGAVVVLLDEAANGVGHRVRGELGLSIRRRAGGRGDRLGREDSGDEVRSGVGGDVEDGVDAVGEHGERVLRREEPDQSHD